MRTGEVPSVDGTDKTRCLTGLREYLGLRGIAVEEDVSTDGVIVPAQFETAAEAWTICSPLNPV